ncbi:GcrA family cell cycle regulator [Nitratireductor sp. StC3]|uniref:GcrA family cell cycle regulator n=1 Tax=Nitratireductor sp. StC3 TaxID=2126741 RepID=UPI000D0D66B0|nr:GcrA family cell cycle regulator [Nitratireductor sp. StC3]PSM18239.1 hypothetical protein C7T96_10235 [Nitratireductor sp. StC3]
MTSHPLSRYSPEEETLIRRLVAERKLSASQIAHQVNRGRDDDRKLTRNAVIGKVRRMGLYLSANPSGGAWSRKSNAPRVKKPAAPYELPGSLARKALTTFEGSDRFSFKVPAPKRKIIDGEPHRVGMRFIDCLPDRFTPPRCRMPVDLSPDGQKGGLDMVCCGILTEPGKSTCEHCSARLVDRSQDRRAAA